MAFLTLNGIELSVLADSGDRDDLEIGEGLSRAWDGSAQRSVRAYKRQWTLQTVPDVPATSQAFVRLLQGRQHHFSFDSDLNSDGGLAPSTSAGATTVGGGKFGNALQLGPSGSIEYSGVDGSRQSDGLTVLVQRFESSAWHDYALTWDASETLTNVYRDGVAQALSLPSWISYPPGLHAVSFGNPGGSAQLYDELVFWPFEAPSTWLAQLATWRATNAWSFGPSLTMAGTLGSVTVQGKPSKSKLQIAVIDGVAYDNAESFSFDLWEV